MDLSNRVTQFELFDYPNHWEALILIAENELYHQRPTLRQEIVDRELFLKQQLRKTFRSIYEVLPPARIAKLGPVQQKKHLDLIVRRTNEEGEWEYTLSKPFG